MNIGHFTMPEQLAVQLQGMQWTAVDAPYSGAFTFKVQSPGFRAYLKILPVGHREPLELYKEKLDWLHGKLAVPRVLNFVKDSSYEYLMMSEVEGRDGTDAVWKQDVSSTVKRLAHGLREVHAVDIGAGEAACPFIYPLQRNIEQIHHKIESGRLNLPAMEPWYGNKVEDIWNEAVRLTAKGWHETLVFTHGDYCVPNVILREEGISGYIDLGDAGVADPYRDFAAIHRSIIRNFGEEWVELFFEAYGLDTLDMSRLRLYDIVDHLLYS